MNVRPTPAKDDEQGKLRCGIGDVRQAGEIGCEYRQPDAAGGVFGHDRRDHHPVIVAGCGQQHEHGVGKHHHQPGNQQRAPHAEPEHERGTERRSDDQRAETPKLVGRNMIEIRKTQLHDHRAEHGLPHRIADLVHQHETEDQEGTVARQEFAERINPPNSVSHCPAPMPDAPA